MIKNLIRSYIINAFALWVVSQYVTGLHLTFGFKSLLIVAGAVTAVHFLITPTITAILGPINLITLGLAGVAIDAALLFLLTIYFPQISLSRWIFTGLTIEGFVLPAYNFSPIATTVLSAAIINIIRLFLASLD